MIKILLFLESKVYRLSCRLRSLKMKLCGHPEEDILVYPISGTWCNKCKEWI